MSKVPQVPQSDPNHPSNLTIQFEDGVQQWEYNTFIIAIVQLDSALQQLGCDGWELIQGFPFKVPDGEQRPGGLIVPGAGTGADSPGAAGGVFMLIFKRPKMVLPNVNSSGLAASQN